VKSRDRQQVDQAGIREGVPHGGIEIRSAADDECLHDRSARAVQLLNSTRRSSPQSIGKPGIVAGWCRLGDEQCAGATAGPMRLAYPAPLDPQLDARIDRLFLRPASRYLAGAAGVEGRH
jgi:hypothetical protein